MKLVKDKDSVRNAVYRAIKNGQLVRPQHCSECGIKARIEAHHEDYNKALEVIWLCHKCHVNIPSKHQEGWENTSKIAIRVRKHLRERLNQEENRGKLINQLLEKHYEALEQVK